MASCCQTRPHWADFGDVVLQDSSENALIPGLANQARSKVGDWIAKATSGTVEKKVEQGHGAQQPVARHQDHKSHMISCCGQA